MARAPLTVGAFVAALACAETRPSSPDEPGETASASLDARLAEPATEDTTVGTGAEWPMAAGDYANVTWLGSLLAALLGGGLGWREWRRWGGGPAGEDGGREGRSRFLALLGMLVSAMVVLAVAAPWSASLFFHPCQ